MTKYRNTLCQDEGVTKNWWFFAPIDLRKKYYFCHHCQKDHLVNEGVVKDGSNKDLGTDVLRRR